MASTEDARDKAQPTVVRRVPMASAPDRPRMRSRWIFAPSADGWSEFAMSEWELQRAGWSDYHPHSETNVVVAGELYVSCDDGPAVVAGVGDTVTVPAGVVGRYWAPTFARMLAIYGPNPDADETKLLGYWEL